MEARFAGTMLGDDSYDLVLEEDADVYKPDGTILLKFRRGVIPQKDCKAAWQNLRKAAHTTSNRGLAGGRMDNWDANLAKSLGRGNIEVADQFKSRSRYHRLKKDGTVSKTKEAIPVLSGLVGFFERSSVRYPVCRTTAYTLEYPDRFKKAMPFIHSINAAFQELMPDRYAAQLAMIQKTHPAWIIHGTAFATITVNKNWQTAVHTDRGDLKQGFGVMAALRAGQYSGGYTVWPAFRVAVNLQTTDVVLADVHEWHGNTPIVGTPGQYERISCVFYYRENMFKCKSPEEELEHAKRRREGDPLWDDYHE